jgi:hypothetical protein
LKPVIANEHITINKNKVLPDGQDYYRLREEGIRLIQQLGSKLWTDYNIHDPGITFLEALCYALTDISYRSTFDVKDIIAVQKPGEANTDEQTFFTAREILTTAPWTINDYRKLMIDIEGVKNGWIKCVLCNCGPDLYVDCKKSELKYTKPAPPENAAAHEVIPKGLYDVLLEFDIDNASGDLNSGKISVSNNVLVNGNPETLFYEVRFPSLQKFVKTQPALAHYFLDKNTMINKVVASNLKDKDKIVILDDTKLKSSLRRGLYVSFEITLNTTVKINLVDVPLRFVWLKDEVRGALVMNDIYALLSDNKKSGVILRYIQKLQSAEKILETVKQELHAHRNITEDFCCVEEVEIEEFGICCDMELAPDADIEQVLANVYYLIGEYFNPEIRFYTLSQMLETKTVDEIFDGPKLKHGFVDETDLAQTVLNRTLYTSDIINLLMDIPGVLAIKNFVLVRFNALGDIQESDPWKLDLSPNKLPRLYIEGSKVLVFKNGLPFLPDIFELMDTMRVIYGHHSLPKLKDTDLDLSMPVGNYYDFKDYYAVQNSLPLVYGTGKDGLPSSADDLRMAQAKQLKAYLLFFEQMLVNYLGQLSHLKEIFSISNTVKQTYFPVLLGDDDIADITELYDSLDDVKLYQLTESEEEFHTRRNKFLDHLLSRFSESFSEYALLLYSYKDQSVVEAKTLINAKTSFLKQFPYQSACKAQSFNHIDKKDIDLRKDLSGLHHRISALLGLQPSLNFFDYDILKVDGQFSTTLTLNDEQGNVLLTSTVSFNNDDRDDLIKDINFNIAEILKVVFDKTKFNIIPDAGEFKIELASPAIAVVAGFATNADAVIARDKIVDFATKNLGDEKFIIVEHILLRPLNKNDALLDVCVEDDCVFCGDEDPYSYRLTFVFNGETELAMNHYEFRRFAEKTIRTEIPAHILCKICWVKKEVYDSFEEAYIDWLNDKYIKPPLLDECKNKTGVNKNPLNNLVCEFKKLKSIYPPATLHDCIDGNDENRVFLNQTNL